jgi:hypothetical protein
MKGGKKKGLSHTLRRITRGSAQDLVLRGSKTVLLKDLEIVLGKHGIAGRDAVQIRTYVKAGPGLRCPPGKKPVLRCQTLSDGSVECKWDCE